MGATEDLKHKEVHYLFLVALGARAPSLGLKGFVVRQEIKHVAGWFSELGGGHLV